MGTDKPSNPAAALLALREQLSTTRYGDRPRLARALDRLFSRRVHDVRYQAELDSLAQQIQASARTVERLRSLQLRMEFDPELPINAHREEIADALSRHQVVVVCGATGSGKTTQLPRICLEAGRGALGLIGHTQPRRIAARAIADRLAAELGSNVGAAVGYQVRFTDRTGPDTRIKVMTDGILLRELENDRALRRYDTVIIDEAHERSLNIDFLFGVFKRLLPQRPELKLIITSATIDPQRFADFFGGAPIIEVSGRSYPVAVRYRPLIADEEGGEADEAELTLPEAVVAAVRELDAEARGDVLVFLPGEKHIREVADALGKARLMHTEVLPLYARLSNAEQERIFQAHHARRVVLATNVAETSLTVPGIRYVVDSGLARISRYSVRGKVQRLPIEPIARASAEQRKGRCGRQSEGICIRLYSQEDFDARAEFTPPELLRTNLASVILQMAALDLGEPEEFPFVDAPDSRLINDGYRLLQELKAVGEHRQVTALGRQIATLPVDPRLARMLIAAGHHGCVAEMLVLAAFLGVQDPRERPAEAQQQADQSHAKFADPRSDFLTVLKLWQAFGENAAQLSSNQLRKWCRENFLAFMRMRDWQELQRQLAELSSELQLSVNATPAGYDQLHQAILTGFLGNIGQIMERREYLGARGSRFVVAPGSPLAARPAPWIVAANLMETTRLYARMCAAVEPDWIEAAGEHLLKRSYSEPHWVEERGFVAAFESTALYGLTLSARRRVNFGNVAPEPARQIFVREALVEGHMRLQAPFVAHNAKLRADIEQLETKVRRRDILVDEQSLCEFYLQRLPPTVNSVSTLQRWLKSVPRNALMMTLPDLLRRGTDDITAGTHPDSLLIAGNRLRLEYRFEPNASDDGVTLVVPEPLMGSLQDSELAWLIPGWRVELLTALLRALPKHIRKSVVPVPDFAARAAREIEFQPDFHAALALWVSRAAGEPVSADSIAALELPAALRFNLRMVDLQGRKLAEGRDLAALRRNLRTRESTVQSVGATSAAHRSWDFGELAHEQLIEQKGLRFKVHPALRDCGDGVQLTHVGTLAQAEHLLRAGVLRLAILALPEQYKYARKRCSEQRELMLLSQGMANGKTLPEALALRAFEECFLEELTHLPRSAAQFQQLLDQRRARFGGIVDRALAHVTEIVREARAVRQKLNALDAPAFKGLRDEVGAQLAALLPASFPAGVPALFWPHLPRYLKALVRRLEKAAGNPKRDQELMAQIARFVSALRTLTPAASEERQLRPEWSRLQWMIEEFRVSLFAQDLRTATPVSDKRLAEQLGLAQAEAGGEALAVRQVR
jgi:ATP-dependent helicase HrpA